MVETNLISAAAATLAAIGLAGAAHAHLASKDAGGTAVPNVQQGAFAADAGWRGVYDELTSRSRRESDDPVVGSSEVRRLGGAGA